MDYPKSVPGVGLVDGKFVDEDQVTGTPGSLIPAGWGNGVTEEILNVIREVGDEPVEAQTNQLVSSIRKMFRGATSSATELLRGVLRIGTQAEVNAGVLDDVAVTPKKLRMGFALSLTPNGYVAFPTWMGGWVIQWMGITHTAGIRTLQSFPFPIAFPNAFLAAACLDYSTVTSRAAVWSRDITSLSGISLHWGYGDLSSANSERTCTVIAIGK